MKVEATPQSMRRIIGGAIREMRDKKGLSQEQLADALDNISCQTISHMEKPNHKGKIAVAYYDKVCSYLGIEFTIRGGAIKE